MLLNYNFKMEVVNDNKNVLFKRQEMSFSTDKNLSFDEARKQIAESTGKAEENIDVRNVKGGFGNQKFLVSANVYDNKEDLDAMTNMELSKKKKKEIEDAKVKAEEDAKAAAEAPAEEAAPVEESSEEKVEETKEEPAAEEKTEEASEEKPADEPAVEEKKEEEAPASE